MLTKRAKERAIASGVMRYHNGNTNIMHIPQASGKRSKAPPGREMGTHNHAGKRTNRTWMGVGAGREGGVARGREIAMNDMRWRIVVSK